MPLNKCIPAVVGFYVNDHSQLWNAHNVLVPSAFIRDFTLLLYFTFFLSEQMHLLSIATQNILSRAREAGSPLKAAAQALTRDTHCPLAH